MIIIDGKEIANKKLDVLSSEVIKLKQQNIIPFLAILIVGSDAASCVYVKNKAKDAKKIGMKAQIFEFDQNISERELLDCISNINMDPNIHGLIIQLPLPDQINKRKILNHIDPKKDVDGFHSLNVGSLYSGDNEGFAPCTPKGCMEIIKTYIPNISGMNAVIVGRSDIVGKPMASLLLAQDCTITICHSKTRGLKEFTKKADIVVTAIGSPKFFDKSYFKEDSFVIDVGINRIEKNDNAKLVGDVDFEDVSAHVKYITPVPGGVGPMTRACLLENTIKAAKNFSYTN